MYPELLSVAVLFVVGLRRLLSVTPPMDCVRPRHMGMVRRFLMLPALVVFCCFTMVAMKKELAGSAERKAAILRSLASEKRPVIRRSYRGCSSILRFPLFHIADDGLPTIVHMDMFDTDNLLPASTQPAENFHLHRIRLH